MKQGKRIFILILFALSWAALFWLTGSRTPWQIFREKDASSGITAPLGDLAGQPYDRMGFGGGAVRWVRGDGSWLVGTDKGELLHISRDGKELWTHALGAGNIQSLSLDPKGTIAYVGEKSPEGWLYAVDIKTGNVLWKFSGKTVIGADLSLRSEPSPVHSAADEDGNVYVSFYRFSTAPDGSRTYLSRIIAFSPDGRELWRYPENENMDAWVAWDTVSSAAGRVALGTSNYDNAGALKYNKNIYILDRATGKEVGSASIPADPHFASATMRNGPNFSADGTLLAAMMSDGRGFLFDADGKELWMRQVSGPQQAGSLWINAAGRDAYVLPGGVMFGTINTFNRENWQLPSPVLHPSSNTLFYFTRDGKFLWKYQAGGEIEEISFTDKTAALAVGRNVRTHNYKVHGASAVDLLSGKEKVFYHTGGPVQSVAISDDGRLMAGIEVPAVTPEGNLIGTYQLHIWEIEK